MSFAWGDYTLNPGRRQEWGGTIDVQTFPQTSPQDVHSSKEGEPVYADENQRVYCADSYVRMFCFFSTQTTLL